MNVTRLEMYKNNNLASCDFDPHLSESSKFKESPNTKFVRIIRVCVCVVRHWRYRLSPTCTSLSGIICRDVLHSRTFHRRYSLPPTTCRRRFHGTMSWICITCMYRRMTIQGLRLLILVLEASTSTCLLVLSVTLSIVFYCYPIATTGFVIRRWQPTSLLAK